MIVLEVAVYAAINEVSKNMPVYPLIRRYKRQKKKLRCRYTLILMFSNFFGTLKHCYAGIAYSTVR
jgi:hypothetical protein